MIYCSWIVTFPQAKTVEQFPINTIAINWIQPGVPHRQKLLSILYLKTLSLQFMKSPSLVHRLKASLQGPEAWALGLELVQGKGPNISLSQCPPCRAPQSVVLKGPIIMHLSVGCQWASFWVVALHPDTKTICQLLGSLLGLQLLK